MKIEDVLPGAGAIVTSRDVVTIRYDLALNRGDVLQRGVVMTVDLRKREVIAGLRQGIVGMRVGGQRRIRVPPHLGYGNAGTGIVPPRAVLVFDVEMLSIL